jgi:hypothetical protein
MSSHAGCTHDNTKAARARCRQGLAQRIDAAISTAEAKRATPVEARAKAKRTRRAVADYGTTCVDCGGRAAFVQDDAARCVRDVDMSRDYRIIPL